MREKVTAIIAQIDGMHPSEAVALLLAVLDAVLTQSADPLAGWCYVQALVERRLEPNLAIDDCVGSA